MCVAVVVPSCFLTHQTTTITRWKDVGRKETISSFTMLVYVVVLIDLYMKKNSTSKGHF